MNKLAVVAVVLLIVSCAAPRVAAPPPPTPAESLEAIIQKRIGPDPDTSTNRDRTFTLYKKEGLNAENGLPVLNYVVVRNGDKRIVEEGSITMGAVEWSSDYELEVSQAQGQVQLERKENSNKRKIDLRTYLR